MTPHGAQILRDAWGVLLIATIANPTTIASIMTFVLTQTPPQWLYTLAVRDKDCLGWCTPVGPTGQAG